MMMRSNVNSSGVKQWASTPYTASAAGSEDVTVTLPNNQVGKPLILKGSGNVSGQISLTFGNGSEVIVPINPNAPSSEAPIPPSGFPNPTGSVAVSITADGAGTIRALVGFA